MATFWCSCRELPKGCRGFKRGLKVSAWFVTVSALVLECVFKRSFIRASSENYQNGISGVPETWIVAICISNQVELKRKIKVLLSFIMDLGGFYITWISPWIVSIKNPLHHIWFCVSKVRLVKSLKSRHESAWLIVKLSRVTNISTWNNTYPSLSM